MEEQLFSHIKKNNPIFLVELLIKTGTDPNECYDEVYSGAGQYDEYTPMLYAIKNSNLSMVRLLSKYENLREYYYYCTYLPGSIFKWIHSYNNCDYYYYPFDFNPYQHLIFLQLKKYEIEEKEKNYKDYRHFDFLEKFVVCHKKRIYRKLLLNYIVNEKLEDYFLKLHILEFL